MSMISVTPLAASPNQSVSMTPTSFDLSLNPYVGKIASRLIRSFTSAPSEDDADRWAMITEVLGFAAEAEQKLSEQNERISQLEALAVTDPLTEIGNRRGLEDFLRRSLANANRHHETGMLAYLDLDDFKALNDTYGHALGDECLRTVAHILSSNIRTTDYVARMGGDEFIVILTHCDPLGGSARLRSLQRFIDKTTLHHEGCDVPLKASLGFVAYGKGDRADLLLKTADAAMYMNKQLRAKNGRKSHLSAVPS